MSFPFLLMLLTFMVFLVVVIIQSLRPFAAFEKLLDDPSIQWDKRSSTFRRGNLNYRFDKSVGGPRTPPEFAVYVACPMTGAKFDVTRKRGTDRFFSAIGVTREVRTGDADFDGRFYLDTNMPEFTRECFSSPVRREAVDRLLFDMSAWKVTLKGGWLGVIWCGSSGLDYGKEYFKEALEVLADAVRDFPRPKSTVPLTYEERMLSDLRSLAMTIASCAFVFGVVGLFPANVYYPALDAWKLFLATLKFSIPLLGLFLFFAVRVVCGHTRSHQDLLVIFFLALFGFPLSGYCAAGLFNAVMDPGPPSTHVVDILDKGITEGGIRTRSDIYHIYVKGWRPGHFYEHLMTSGGIYERIVCGRDKARFITKPGKLGYEWIVSWKVE